DSRFLPDRGAECALSVVCAARRAADPRLDRDFGLSRTGAFLLDRAAADLARKPRLLRSRLLGAPRDRACHCRAGLSPRRCRAVPSLHPPRRRADANAARLGDTHSAFIARLVRATTRRAWLTPRVFLLRPRSRAIPARL